MLELLCPSPLKTTIAKKSSCPLSPWPGKTWVFSLSLQPAPLEFEELLQSLIVGIPNPVTLWTMLRELVSDQYLGSKGTCLFNLAKAISAVLLRH